MAVIAIVAIAQNLAIGKDGGLPWHYPSDSKFFKETTTGNAVVMGYKTWLSLPKPLPNRLNVVLSRTANIETAPAVLLMRHRESVLALNCYLNCELYVMGGASIYELFQENIERWIVTEIPETIQDADTFMPSDFLAGFRLRETLFLPDGLQIKTYERDQQCAA